MTGYEKSVSDLLPVDNFESSVRIWWQKNVTNGLKKGISRIIFATRAIYTTSSPSVLPFSTKFPPLYRIVPHRNNWLKKWEKKKNQRRGWWAANVGNKHHAKLYRAQKKEEKTWKHFGLPIKYEISRNTREKVQVFH